MATAKKVAPTLAGEVKKELAGFDTMSAKIRYLASLEYSRADISRILTKTEDRYVRYQWVKNVLDQAAKK
ncbi:hypothetical protein GWO13_01495 [Candidatus Bathyarchaeota archaeon]|nr:hypothetical protein [Candidatus Bathyarchaeota archaeon]NIW97455.1 hypothetical protein [Phycisphaerae bacterium]